MQRPIVICIVGVSRSGSSILERLIESAPGFVGVGEAGRLFQPIGRLRPRCRCGCTLPECPFWAPVLARSFGDWEGIDHAAAEFDSARVLTSSRAVARALHLGGGSNDAVRYRSAVERLYSAVAETAAEAVPDTATNTATNTASTTPIIVDAAKRLAHVQALARSELLDVRILHLVRDPRGIVHSWQKRGIDLAPIGIDGYEMPRISPARAALATTASNLAMEFLRRSGAPYHLLRYEDFAADPVGRLDAALDALGIGGAMSWDHVDGRTVTLAASHSLLGNPGVAPLQSATIRVDDEWRTAMPRRTYLMASALSLPTLIRFRYRIRRSPRTFS